MTIVFRKMVCGVALTSLIACGESTVEVVAESALDKVEEEVVALPIAPMNEDSTAGVLTKDDVGVTTILSAYDTKKVSPRTYVIHGPLELPNKANAGFMNNPAFIVTEKSVVVIDPGSSTLIGKVLVQRIKKITGNPVTHVFITHVHGDHWLANEGIKSIFPAAAFYAHPVMIEKAKGGEAEHWVGLMMELTDNKTSGTQAVIPEKALTNLQEIKIDEVTIKAHLSVKAHSLTDAMYEFVEDKVLFTGDNVTHKRIPRMVDGSFTGNIAAANYGLALPIDVVVPGHGPTGGKEVLSAYGNYLSIVYEGVKALTDEGLEPYEMKAKLTEKLAEYSDWVGLDEQLGKQISQSVLEAEEEDF